MMRIQRSLIGVLLCAAAMVSQAADSTPSTSTLLGVRGGQFTLNGQPRFLLGWSYYGALGAPQEAVRKDLDDAQRLGFNWLRVWATWNAFGQDVSAVDTNGMAREPFLAKLEWLIAECDRRGLAVDVTLTRGETLRGFAVHQRAVETLVDALKPHDNWFLDLANEHDVRDARFVSDAELTRLRELVRRRDPSRLVTASFGGHDLAPREVREALLNVGLDFLTPHRPRTAQSARETEAQTQGLRTVMRRLGRQVPILYQEPFRRGYTRWEPQAEDFLNDLRGAFTGGAAGWCFHNGQQADAADKQPRRSFDLRKRRLFDQLDAVEQRVVQQAASELVEVDTSATKTVGAAVATAPDAPEPALAPTDTHAWARWETTLHSSKTYGNPYRDVTLRVTYTGPTGQVQRAYGFWDGGDTFRIRCAFPTPGLWRWRTDCSDPANTGLHAHTGTVKVTAYRGGNPLYRHGFLRVSEDRRYLCHADGTPFLWMGDTVWAAPMHATQADWETYLQDRVTKHFTVVQVAVAPWWAGAKDRQGQPAFLGEHLERWNPAFWKEYEQKINAANDQGIFVLIVGIMEPTTRYPDAPEAIRFAHQIAARFYGHFVAFSPSFDSGYRALGDAVGAALREATSVHLITQHPGTPSGQAVNTIAETYFDRPYLNFAGDQSGHNGGNLERCSRQAIEWNLHLFQRRPPKPVINLEAMYDTDSPDTIRPNAWRGEDARRLAYQSWLSGALGYTYGTDLYEWVNDASNPGYWAGIIKLPSSTEMKHLHDLLAQLPWWQLRPDHSRVLDLPKSFVKRPVFARTESFDTALAYSPTEDPIELNLADFPQKLSVRWYNPRTGEYAGRTERRAPSARVDFTPPGTGDWVLVLKSGRKKP